MRSEMLQTRRLSGVRGAERTFLKGFSTASIFSRRRAQLRVFLTFFPFRVFRFSLKVKRGSERDGEQVSMENQSADIPCRLQPFRLVGGTKSRSGHKFSRLKARKWLTISRDLFLISLLYVFISRRFRSSSLARLTGGEHSLRHQKRRLIEKVSPNKLPSGSRKIAKALNAIKFKSTENWTMKIRAQHTKAETSSAERWRKHFSPPSLTKAATWLTTIGFRDVISCRGELAPV